MKLKGKKRAIAAAAIAAMKRKGTLWGRDSSGKRRKGKTVARQEGISLFNKANKKGQARIIGIKRVGQEASRKRKWDNTSASEKKTAYNRPIKAVEASMVGHPKKGIHYQTQSKELEKVKGEIKNEIKKGAIPSGFYGGPWVNPMTVKNKGRKINR